jgi:hypothetical protein
MNEPKPITQGSVVTLINVLTGQTDKYILWDLVFGKDEVWRMDLKRPDPDNTVEYVLRIEGEGKIAKGKSSKRNVRGSKGGNEQQLPDGG